VNPLQVNEGIVESDSDSSQHLKKRRCIAVTSQGAVGAHAAEEGDKEEEVRDEKEDEEDEEDDEEESGKMEDEEENEDEEEENEAEEEEVKAGHYDSEVGTNACGASALSPSMQYGKQKRV
jgi:archaellum component FlaD/FlaE